MDASHLSLLPLEFRCHVYELVLAQPHDVSVSLASECRPAGYDGIASLNKAVAVQTPTRYPLGLSQTCAQLHREAMESFFSVNIFKMALSLTSSPGFPTAQDTEEKADQLINSLKTLLAEIRTRIGEDGQQRRKRVGLVLDFGDLPMRTLDFHGEHKMIAAFLRKAREVTEGYRRTTSLDPQIHVSLILCWYTIAGNQLVRTQFTQKFIAVEIDLGKGYDSLHRTIERVESEHSGDANMDELLSEMEGNVDTDYWIAIDASILRKLRSKRTPRMAAQVERAIDVMRLWQKEFLPH